MLNTALFDSIKAKPQSVTHNKLSLNPYSLEVVQILRQTTSEVVKVVSTATDFYLLLYFRDVLLKNKTMNSVEGFDPLSGELCYLSDDITNITLGSHLRKVFDQRLDWIDRFMFTYLCAACSGELRHASGKSNISDTDRKELSAFGIFGSEGTCDLSRSATQHRFLSTVTESSIGAFLTTATRIFMLSGWGGSFGGKKWADISKTGEMRLNSKIDRIQFIDRVYDLKHNGGPIFDKNKSVSNDSLQSFLDAKLEATKTEHWQQWLKHCTKDVLTLVEHAKKAKLWEGVIPKIETVSYKKSNSFEVPPMPIATPKPPMPKIEKITGIEYKVSTEIEKCQTHIK